MIELTVALPIWNSEKIAWLSLESLCRQKNIDFKWELVIAEEIKNAFGAERIKQYADRLKAVGCESIKYCELDYRIPLPQKWKLLANMSSASSAVFVFWSADDYHEPNKLRTSYDNITLGYDWTHYRRCLFYDIATKRHVAYDCASIKRPVGNLMACRTELLKNIPDSSIPKGVDTWLFNTIAPKFTFLDETDNWKEGFATDGLNNISLTRRIYYTKPEPPFSRTDLDIKSIIPKEIVNRLNSLI